MKTFEKNYIGKGKQIANMKIVRFTLKIEEVLQHKYSYNGEEYITLEIAELQSPDKFENTHTVYVNKRVETAEPVKAAPAKEKKQPKAAKKEKTQAASSQEIPF